MLNPGNLKKLFAILILIAFILLIVLDFDLSKSTVRTRASLFKFKDSFFNALSLENAEETENALRPRVICSCPPEVTESLSANVPTTTKAPNTLPLSTCSPEADGAGPGQLILSYSFYKGNRKRGYAQDLKEILNMTREFYPEWLVRLYGSVRYTEEFCESICASQDTFFYCPIEYIDQRPPHNVSKGYPRQWRFLPLSDPTVTRFLSRDLDSRPGQRERDAVTHWESSAFPFHVMRDHHFHRTAILAGMWGADNERLKPNVASKLQQQLVHAKRPGNEGDQSTLRDYLFNPFLKSKSFLIHDSYSCTYFKDGAVPWPTQRKDLLDFVGKPVGVASYNVPVKICPPVCRPKAYPMWKYC